MKSIYSIKTLVFIVALMSLTSCKDTWLMYDTTQKDQLYFTVKGMSNMQSIITNEVSFALLSGNQIEQSIPIYLLGKVENKDRRFELEILPDTTRTIISDNQTREVVNAISEDYSIGDLIIPAGQVSGKINITINRSDKLKDKTVSLLIGIKESDGFRGVVKNRYRILFSDGEPVSPPWWIYGQNPDGTYVAWYQYLGKFTPAKYRKLLEFYHGIEQKNPLLYARMIEKYGYYIDKQQLNENGELTDLLMGFMVNKTNPEKVAWVRYVLCAMYDYYSVEYPDDEVYTESSVSVTTKGWRNPARNY